METVTQTLGPIQQMLVRNLREHPERQTKDLCFVKGNSKDYVADVVGELVVCYHRVKKIKVPFLNGTIKPKHTANIAMECGLRNTMGSFDLREKIFWRGKLYCSLAHMNDEITWNEIADFIEENSELVFIKSV